MPIWNEFLESYDKPKIEFIGNNRFSMYIVLFSDGFLMIKFLEQPKWGECWWDLEWFIWCFHPNLTKPVDNSTINTYSISSFIHDSENSVYITHDLPICWLHLYFLSSSLSILEMNSFSFVMLNLASSSFFFELCSC